MRNQIIMYTGISRILFTVVIVINQSTDGDDRGFTWHCLMAMAAIRFKASNIHFYPYKSR